MRQTTAQTGLLSRTADNLYWIARYMERADNLARILHVADRMAMMPGAAETGPEGSEWHSAVIISGCQDTFYEHHDEATQTNVVSFIACDKRNPSSIRSCIELARRNARSVRTALTTDVWEALNSTWLDLPAWTEARIVGGGLLRFLDWVNDRSLLYMGATQATMLRLDSFYFTRLGTFIERADSTARILDVKYHILLPEHAEVGGGLDYSQWAAILRAVSAHRAYHLLYPHDLQPWYIAELLILREEMPRSLVSCMSQINDLLDRLAEAYGERNESQRLAGQIHSRLLFARTDDIFQHGLHEFLTQFIENNNALGSEISRSYLL